MHGNQAFTAKERVPYSNHGKKNKEISFFHILSNRENHEETITKLHYYKTSHETERASK